MGTVYIGTSIVSYLIARPSRDVITLARQELTREWWRMRRHRFDLYTADIVVGEAAEGHDEAVERRLAMLDGVQKLETTPEAEDLADDLLRKGLFRRRPLLMHAYRHCDHRPDRLFADVESHAHCKRSDAKTD